MFTLPRQFVLPIKPAEYLKQGPTHCGAFSVKGILSAYGMDTTTRPQEYHPNWFGKLTGLTPNKNYFSDILRSRGVYAEDKTAAQLKDLEKIHLLKKLIANGNPVMVRIGNGYFTSKQYNPILGRIVSHWITLWGYDDAKGIFYVYDSGFPRKYWNHTLPIGNTTRTYNEMLRDGRFGRWQFWYWYMGKKNFVYIQVRKN